ncbi:MAG: hypothetical protein H7335_01465 [Massilia sp.]|nr:hypothetical protein [Massilia sp.]
MQNVLATPALGSARRPHLQRAEPGARAATAATLPVHGFGPAAVRNALAHLLASEQFCKAQRMRRLITFLVEKELAGARHETAEYTIGIEVFDRDALKYSTSDDPIVRVQVGRLRDRLKTYYAASGAQAPLRFSIPIGSYMPVISQNDENAGLFLRDHLLAIAPLFNFIQQEGGGAFTQGLNEELSYQLFKVFGNKIVSHSFTQPEPAAASGPGRPIASHVLEGSVRADGDLVRVSLRLVDASAGCIAWSDQFDRRGPLAMHVQEALALAICGALKRYFEQG